MKKNVNPAGPIAVLALVVLACGNPPETPPGLEAATALVAAAPAAAAQPVYVVNNPRLAQPATPRRSARFVDEARTSDAPLRLQTVGFGDPSSPAR